MVCRSRTWSRPEQLSLRLVNWDIVDTGFSPPHQAALVEFPQFVAVAAKPATRIIVPFILKSHSDSIISKRPECLHQPVVELARPLAS